MKFRCPTAKLIGTGIIRDYELQFKGYPQSAFATIGKKQGAIVPVGVWEIQPKDEFSLDRYEGFPSHYFKKMIPVDMKEGGRVNGMVYVMNLKMDYGQPSTRYLEIVSRGYMDCGLDLRILQKALEESSKQYYGHTIERMAQDFVRELEKGAQEDELEEDFGDEEEYEQTSMGLGDFTQ